MKNDLIVSDPEVMMGKPMWVEPGSPVELILEALAAGDTINELLEDWQGNISNSSLCS